MGCRTGPQNWCGPTPLRRFTKRELRYRSYTRAMPTMRCYPISAAQMQGCADGG
nr:MAG TPA: hypothetical protein [Caudoviricetes sp.]